MRKKTNFGVTLLIVFLSCLLVFTGVLAFLWTFLKEFEKTNPKNCINEYVELIKSSDYEGAMALSETEATQFFSAIEYEKYVKEMLGSYNDLQIYEIASSVSNERYFEIKGDTDKAIRFVLTQSEELYKYNFRGYKLRQMPVEKYSYMINLPNGMVPIVNSVQLNESNLVGDKLPVSAYDTLNDKTKIPTISTYKVDGLVFDPNIEVNSLEQNQYVIEKTQDRIVNITLIPAEKDITAEEQLAVNTAIAYSKYIFKDIEFEELKKFIYPETTFYKRVQEYSNVWTVEHNAPTFEKIKVKNTIEFSKDHFQTEVYFDHIITKQNIKKVYPISYRMSFIKIQNEFKLANLEVLD